MGQFSNYYEYVSNEAESFVGEYIEELIEDIENGNTDVYSFIDDYRLHEWCDNDFIYVDLIDSAEIIDQSNNVETDSGLWEGQEPQEAIKTQAFFTYRNDMYWEIKEQVEEKLNDRLSELEEELQPLQEQFDALDNKDELSEEEEDEMAELEEEIDTITDAISNFEEAINRL